jgi:putative redox protein
MITARAAGAPFQTTFSDSIHEGLTDTTADKGGSHAGFRPHDLLEAALATCVAMTVRMYAQHHGVPLEGVTASLRLDRSRSGETEFRYSIELAGDLTEEQRERLRRAAGACPVRRTLSQAISFTME